LQKKFKKKIGVFFSNNTSLEEWKKKGFLDREINYYKKLSKENLDITFFTYGDKKDLTFKRNFFPIKIIPFYAYLNFPKLTFLRTFLNLFFPIIFKKEILKLDVIKSNQVWGAIIPCFIKFFYKIPFYIRSGWEPSYKPSYFDISKFKIIFIKINSLICYKYTDYILVSSRKIFFYIRKTFKIKRNISILENFIDTKIFKPQKKKRNKNQVLMVSRVTPQKNINLLISALSGTNILILHAGFISKEKKSEITRFAKVKKTKLKLLGSVKNKLLLHYYNISGAYIICSKIEGNPKSLIEAMACKCPVVGTNVEGINDIIKNNKNGVLCSENALNLKKSIIKVLNNKEFQKKITNDALCTIKRNNSLDRFVKVEMKIINKLCKN
jgi:glycosyltransferase involved in cell wall biosynthesis